MSLCVLCFEAMPQKTSIFSWEKLSMRPDQVPQKLPLALQYGGRSIRYIADRLTVTHNTVSDTIKRFTETDSY